MKLFVVFVALVAAVSADGHHHTGTDIASVRATLNTTLTAAASVLHQSNISIANFAVVVQNAAALTGILSEVITSLTSVYHVVATQAPQFQEPTSITEDAQIQAFAEHLSESVIGAVTIIQNAVGDETAQVATASNTVISSYETMILAGFAVNSDVSVSTISAFADAISGTYFATSRVIQAIQNVLASVAAGTASAAVKEASNGLAVVLTTILQSVVAGASKVAVLNIGLTKPVLEMLTTLIARAKDALQGVTAIVDQLSVSISTNGNVLDVSFLATAVEDINASFSANQQSFHHSSSSHHTHH